MNYSVTIRTLGTAGEKYQKTLNSIAKQTIQPQEVIVVLPKDYPLPSERLGTEKFVFSEKGMVSQRVIGFNACTSDYILALDDDVEFDSDFVASLLETIEATNSDMASPIVKGSKHGG